MKAKNHDNVSGNKKLTFASIKRADVPHGRRGKHHELVVEILADIEKLRKGSALKVPRSAFGKAKMTNVRAALNRAAEQAEISLGTSSDEEFFYVWRERQ